MSMRDGEVEVFERDMVENNERKELVMLLAKDGNNGRNGKGADHGKPREPERASAE